jgi:DNA segregation ATPase FtsK/SpoIIIE, S-DNA-T family
MTSRLIEKKLGLWRGSALWWRPSPGPVITRYEIEPATGVKGSQIVNLAAIWRVRSRWCPSA